VSVRDVLLALVVVALWGFNFVVMKWGLESVPPLLLMALRFAFAAVPAVFFIKRPNCAWAWIVGFGLILGVAKFSLLIVGLKLGMPAGLSSLVLQVQAFFTMAFAVVLLGDRPLPVQIGGAVIAALGIAVIGSGRLEGASLGPLLMVIAAAACWGLANIVAKKAGRVDMLAFVVWSSLFAPLPLLALSLTIEGPQAVAAALSGMTWKGIGSVLFQAGPTTLFGFAIWNGLLGRLPVATVAPFSLLVPVFGMTSGVIFLGESIGMREALGAALVIAGLIVNVFGPRVAARLRRGSAV
jgi:O-acetylserine/cysteine efflux transporter